MAISWGSFTVVGLLGVLIGHFLSHILVKKRAKLDRKATRRNQAVADFKSAFSDALINLHYREHTVALILQQTFNTHKIAYIRFRDNLSEKMRVKFDQVWSKYEDNYNTYSKGQVFTLFASAKTEYESQHREFIVGLIKELMSFAKEV